jgi:putative Holliday junction resolvase
VEEKRILAIDFGEKRIGLAVTDPLNIFAYPLMTISNDADAINKLKSIIDEYHVVEIILGNPIKESGSNSKIYEAVVKFKEKIERVVEMEIKLVDERYSSSIAKQRIIESISSKKKRRDKTLIDQNSAAVILEDYLKIKGR